MRATTGGYRRQPWRTDISAALLLGSVLLGSVLRRTSGFSVQLPAHCRPRVGRKGNGHLPALGMSLDKRSRAHDVLEAFDADLRGRTALVTGGNTGLGLETSKALASRGCRVVICALDADSGLSLSLSLSLTHTHKHARARALSLSLSLSLTLSLSPTQA